MALGFTDKQPELIAMSDQIRAQARDTVKKDEFVLFAFSGDGPIRSSVCMSGPTLDLADRLVQIAEATTELLHMLGREAGLTE